MGKKCFNKETKRNVSRETRFTNETSLNECIKNSFLYNNVLYGFSLENP